MISVIFILLLNINVYAVNAKQGEIVCNLCIDTVEHIKDVVETKGIEQARAYLEGLCTQAPGFLNTICTDFVDFGFDEILKLIENRVQPQEICQKMEACPESESESESESEPEQEVEVEPENMICSSELRDEKIVCKLCSQLIDTMKNILDKNGGKRVKQYLDTLCAKASGFIATICEKVVNFGIDKLIDLIENKVDSTEICTKIHLC